MVLRMKVKEIIEILKSHDPENEVILFDPDTGWNLPVYYVGNDLEKINEHGQDRMTVEDMKPNSIYIVSNYWCARS